MVLCFKFQVLTVCNVPFLEALISSPSKVSLGRVDGLKADLFLSSTFIHRNPWPPFFYAHSKRFSSDVPASALAILLIFPGIFVLLEAMRSRFSFTRNLTWRIFGASTDRNHWIPTCFFFDLGFFEFTGVSRWGPLGMSRLVTAWDSFETETGPEKKTTGNSRPGFGHAVGPWGCFRMSCQFWDLMIFNEAGCVIL